jgi:YidC/Oxa1 family membrane protein insertase
MDRKSIVILVVCFILLMLWFPLVNRIFPPKPLPPGATNALPVTVTGTNQAGTNPPQLEQASQPLPSPGGPGPATPAWAMDPNVREETLELTNASARYIFTSKGGGLKQVDLLEYTEIITERGRAQPRPGRATSLNASAPLPSLAIIDGPLMGDDGDFRLSRSENGVRAEKVLPNGLALVKTFALSTNYLVASTVRLENRSGQTLQIPAQEWVVGTATPMSAKDDFTTVGVMWFNGSGEEDISEPWFQNKTLGCFPGTPRSEFRGGQSNVVWVAVHNQFFTLAAMPQNPALSVVVRKTPLPHFASVNGTTTSSPAPPPNGYSAALVYPASVLAPGEAIEREIHLFAGPKEYQTLARIGARFNNDIDRVMGFGGFFGFFSKALLLSMNWLHNAVSLSYGWAIIVITIIIKLLFWPLTQASTRSMKRMQALQPQMKAIQEKYKEDPAKMNRKVMEFMRENKVSPLGGCLPMLLQMPVFIGFFYMIRSAIELRGASFLWVKDLSRPDTLFMIPGLGFIPFIGVPGEGLPFNLLPLIMGVTMWWQAQLTPPSPGMDPTQAKIMRYMPMIFVLFLYNFSAGLTLYWTVQNMLTIAQTKLTSTNPRVAAPAPVPATPPRKKK